MKSRRSQRGFRLNSLLFLSVLLSPLGFGIQDDSDYFSDNVTISNFEFIAKDNDSLETLFKDRQFATFRDLKTYSFREREKIVLKQSKYSSLLEIPIDESTRRDIEDIMVFPRETTSLGPYQHRQRRFLFFGYSDEVMRETAKTIAFQYSWLYYEMDFGQILLKFLHIENPEEYALAKFLFKNAADESKRCRKPFLIVIKDIEGLLSLSANYESLFVIQKIRKWMFQELESYASPKNTYSATADRLDDPDENLIVVFTSTQPSNINELLIERFGLHAIFFDFPSLKNQKVLLARQIHEFELSLRAFTTIGDWFETAEDQQEDEQRQASGPGPRGASGQGDAEANNSTAAETKEANEVVLDPPERRLFRPLKSAAPLTFSKTPELVESISVFRNNKFLGDKPSESAASSIAEASPPKERSESDSAARPASGDAAGSPPTLNANRAPANATGDVTGTADSGNANSSSENSGYANASSDTASSGSGEASSADPNAAPSGPHVASSYPLATPLDSNSSGNSNNTGTERANDTSAARRLRPSRTSFLQLQLKSGLRAKEMCKLPTNTSLFQFVKKDGVVIVIENRRDPLLREIKELLGNDNVVLIQGNRTCIMFDAAFERFLLESAVAVRVKHLDNTEDFAYYDKPGYIPEDIKELIKKTIQVDIRKTFKSKKKSRSFPIIITPNQVEENLLITAETLKEAIMAYNPLVSLRKANNILEWALMHNYISAKLEDVSRNITRMLLGPDPDSLNYAKFTESAVVPVPIRVNTDPAPFTAPRLPDIPSEVELTPIDPDELRDPRLKLEEFFARYFSGKNMEGNSERISKLFSKFLSSFAREEKGEAWVDESELRQRAVEQNPAEDAAKTIELQIQEIDRKIEEVENFKKTFKANKAQAEQQQESEENSNAFFIKKVKSTIQSLIKEKDSGDFGDDQRMQSLESRANDKDDRFYFDLVSSLLNVTRAEKLSNRKKINRQLDNLLSQALEYERNKANSEAGRSQALSPSILPPVDQENGRMAAPEPPSREAVMPSASLGERQQESKARLTFDRVPSIVASTNNPKERPEEAALAGLSEKEIIERAPSPETGSESRKFQENEMSEGGGQGTLMKPAVLAENPYAAREDEAQAQSRDIGNPSMMREEAPAGPGSQAPDDSAAAPIQGPELLFLPEEYQESDGGEAEKQGEPYEQ